MEELFVCFFFINIDNFISKSFEIGALKFPRDLAVIHTESRREMCTASGPSALVPWSQIGQVRPFTKTRSVMCYVSSDQQPPPSLV